ncbi:MAG TPA: hypothetical protein VMN39_12500 [Longimicrobiaceae bacterium]|nr:hypothetical protein [Longimicrobiaceae bacterium]
MEDRLNPIAPEGADESTLGGYAAIHGRAPAFEGADGLPYTPAIESEAAEDAWVAYLVFVRWAQDSTAVMGHLESDDLAHAPTERQAREAVERMPLTQAKSLLDRLIAERREWAAE